MTDETRNWGPHCATHPDTALICPKCVGAKGGVNKSRKKKTASRRNGKLGGRPRKLADPKLA
jgi:hypothetical protein